MIKWDVAGVTQDVNRCDRCGKLNLKKTYILRELDGEGEIYVGCECAKYYLGGDKYTAASLQSLAHSYSVRERQRQDIKAATLKAEKTGQPVKILSLWSCGRNYGYKAVMPNGTIETFDYVSIPYR